MENDIDNYLVGLLMIELDEVMCLLDRGKITMTLYTEELTKLKNKIKLLNSNDEPLDYTLYSFKDN